jgi:hypothetical protein
MSDTSSAPPPGRKGASRRLRALRCPLSAEILVAEFAGELPPNVASAVRKHVANCVICGPRAEELRASYDLVGSLGAEPVATPPDLRERVYIRTQTVPLARQRKRLALVFPRAIWGVLIGGLALAVIAVLVTQWLITPARTQAATRSSNALTNVPAAGASGELLAATSTLIPVRDKAGQTWRVAEVVAADERTGAITRSLPVSDMPAETGDPTTLPVAIRVTVDGSTVVELTAPDDQKRQALVSFDVQNGATHVVASLALPAGSSAVSLAPSPTEPLAFVGLRGAQAATGPRVLVIDLRSGALVRTLAPTFDPTAPLMTAPVTPAGQARAIQVAPTPTPTVTVTPTPSPTAAASPTPTPFINATGWQIAQAAHGDIGLSPDGQSTSSQSPIRRAIATRWCGAVLPRRGRTSRRSRWRAISPSQRWPQAGRAIIPTSTWRMAARTRSCSFWTQARRAWRCSAICRWVGQTPPLVSRSAAR